MKTLMVASIQINSSNILDDNLSKISLLIKKAVNSGAELIVLPEYALNIESDNKELVIQNAEELGYGAKQDYFAKMARENNVYLVAGTIPIRTKIIDKVYNSCLVFDNSGNIISYYHKIHLFKYLDMDEYNESKLYLAGANVATFNIGKFSFGLAICYDLRFPELFRAYTGVDGIIVPAAFTYETGIAHWEILLRARAIENQCYLISSAQTGLNQNNRQTYGHSMMIDPWGEIESIINTKEGVIINKLEKNKIANIRKVLPAISNILLN